MEKRKKVGIIITRMVAGGASKVVRQLIVGGVDRYEFVLFTGPDDLGEGELDDLKNFCEIRWIPDLVRSISPIRDFSAYRALRREIRGLNLDVVHTHTSKAGVLGRFAAYAENVPRIIHSTHGSIYESGSGIDGVPDMSLLKWFLLWSEQVAGKRSDILTVLSERERKLCLSLALDSDARIHVVPNGIDAASFAVDDLKRRKARLEMGFDDEFVVLSVGRLSSEKGHSVLLEAFAKLAGVGGRDERRLVIVGDGPEMDSLKKRAAELAGVPLDKSSSEFGNVIFMGHFRDIRGFLACADLFVLPSLYEGFGIVLLEAMAAGVPIVASRTGGVPEVIDDGIDGVLVDSGDPYDLAAAITRVSSNAELAIELAMNAKRKVELYSLDGMLDRYFNLYEN